MPIIMCMYELTWVLVLFRSLHDNMIKPTIKNLGVVYDVNGIELSKEQLSELEHEGLLVGSGYEYYPSCNVCNSMALTTLLLCPSCKSSMLEKHDLIVHYDCGSISSLQEIVSSNGIYKCSKCSKSFNRIGIDYGRPGYGFKCIRCNTITQFPLVSIICDKGHSLSPYDLNINKVKCYTLSSEAKRFAKIYDELLHVKDRLTRADSIYVDVLYKVKGLSGVEHIVALYIRYKDDITITIDYIANASVMDWFRIITKVMDIPNTLSIIITADEDIESNILSLLNKYKIRLVTLDGMSIADAIVREVESIVCKA